MKDLDNFRYLPIKEKKEILDTQGKNICSLNSHGLTISLYCLDKHFVEVFQEGNKLVGVRILEDKKRLRFYARNLDLRFLLNQSLLGILFLVGQAHQEILKYAA
jgi:hypothetical protein